MNKELIKRILSSIIILPIVFYAIIEGSFYFILLIISCLLVAIYEWLKMINNSYIKISGILFLILSFYTIYQFRFIFNNNYYPFLIILLISIFTDVGGFLFGKLFKGPKLIKISPNKTYAGMIGSYFLCILGYYFFVIKLNNIDYIQNSLFVIFLISTTSQFGDLAISYFKRKSKIKDTGKIIPGHGGILDRIDGMIFAFPFSYLLFSINLLNFNL